jgi:hypothetical protein
LNSTRDDERLQLRPHLRRLAGEVDAQPGEHAREFLHVGLRVAAVDAERVQLQQFARVVFVDAVGGVGLVVEVAQHRRVQGTRAEQVAKAAERVRAQSIFVVADHRPQVVLVLMDVEVVEPEPRHLLAQLRRRVHGAQHQARAGLAGLARQLLLIGLLRQLLLLVVGDGIGRLALVLHLHHQGVHRRARDAQGVDLGLHRGGQRARRARIELPSEETLAALT